MYLRIPKLLNAEQLAAVSKMMADAAYVEGKETGGAAIKDIKNNLQVDRTKVENIQETDQAVLGALSVNPTLRSALLPRRILPPYYVKYTSGMNYGLHVDNPLMSAPGGGASLRTDASITIFINSPDDYDGGELQIKSEAGDAQVKLPAGDAIIYPTGDIHQVLPVTRGERHVVVTWIQSMIADPHKRRIVYELDLVCQSLLQKMPESDEHRALLRNYGNLIRLWGEP